MRDTNPGAYRAIWRWHFYAGLMVAPFVLLLSLTGALYLFDREIEGVFYADRMHVPAVRAPLPLLDQQAAVLRAYPGATVKRIVLPERPTDAGQWLVARDGVDTLVFVDPGSGRVTGDIDPEWRLMAVVRRIHGTLLAGQVGSYIVELMACWTLIMLGTGLILWWPRHWRLRGVFVPRLAARGRRFWRDLHAIPAMVNALLVMGLILTGLPWSAFWGVQFARVGAVSPLTEPSPNFRDPPEHAEHKLTTADGVPWTIANSPAPHGGHGHGHGRATLADVERALSDYKVAPGARIFLPQPGGSLITISLTPDQAERQRTLYLDAADGSVIDDIGWADYSPLAKAVEWGTMTHMGRQFGLANQLLALAVALTLAASVVTGVYMWWCRRPRGQLAAPGGVQDRLPRPVKLMIATIAALFPLVGASLVLAVTVEGILGAARRLRRA